jgi:hypothetical protein
LHLAPRQIEGYAKRSLPPGELLAADDHLAECAQCRLAVAERVDLAGPLAAWEALDAPEVADRSERPERAGRAEGLRRAGRADDLERLGRAEGLERSGRAEAKEQRLAGGSPRGPAFPAWRRPRVLAWAAGLVLAVLLGAVLMRSWSDGEGRRDASVQPGGTAPSEGATSGRPAPDGTARIGDAGARPPEESGGEGLSAREGSPQSLADGARTLTLAPPGKLAGLEGAPAAWERLAREAWIAGRLATPALLVDLRSGSETLRGAGTGAAGSGELAPLEPVGSVVRQAAPAFRWSPLPGAESYRVRVYDLSFRLVAESPALTPAGPAPVIEWTPPAPLARGAIYSWQVSATRGDETLTAPQPPRAEARFRVLGADELREIERAEALKPSSHLLLATLYARAGLVTAAERELAALELQNPGAPALRRLRASLRSGV